MLNKLFSRIGKSIAPSGGGVVSAVSAKKEGNLPYGTFVSEETIIYFTDVATVNTAIGTFYRTRYADGNGGTYFIDSSVTYYEYGTTLRTDNGEYTVNICSGTFSVGSWGVTYYSDGVGGYFQYGGVSYLPYGTYITSCDGYDHYSDGNGSSYSQGGYSAPSDGTLLTSSSSDITYYFSNEFISTNLVVGSSYYNTYADGTGGSYSESGSNYVSYGTQLGSYYDYNSYTTYYIYSDGMGGVYTFN